MDFLTRYRSRFRLTAIFGSLSFNFFMIYAAWAQDKSAWITSYVIAGISIICALICQFTQENPINSTETCNEI